MRKREKWVWYLVFGLSNWEDDGIIFWGGKVESGIGFWVGAELGICFILSLRDFSGGVILVDGYIRWNLE